MPSAANRIRLLGMAFGVGLLGATGCDKAAPQAVAPAPPVVTVASPIVRPFVAYSEFTGRVEPEDSVELRARVGGFLKQVHFADGDFVKQGDLLFTIDQAPFEAVIRERQAAVEKAKSALGLATATVERNRPLVEKGAISRQEFDVQNAQAVQAQAEVVAAEAALNVAQLELSYTTITAPFSGRISDAKISVGALVVSGNGGGGTLLATMVSLEPAYVSFDIGEQILLQFRKPHIEQEPRRTVRELNVPVSLALGSSRDFTIPGVLDYGDAAVNPATGTIRVRARFDNADRQLLPGLFVRVRVALDERPEAVMVPVRALGQDQDRRYVFVLDAQKTVQYRPITVGPQQDGLVAVENGLAAGDTVIVDGLLRVRPGVVPDAKPADMSAYGTAPSAKKEG